MRRNNVLCLKVGFALSLLFTIFLFFQQSSFGGKYGQTNQQPHDLNTQLGHLEEELDKQSSFYISLLNELKKIEVQVGEGEHGDTNGILLVKNDGKMFVQADKIAETVLPILLISCNREAAVKRSLDLLIKYRPSATRFPIIVSQDCGHKRTREVIESYGSQVKLIQQPDLSAIQVPPKEVKFRGYFLIARHYRWALDQIFLQMKYQAVVIVEEDLDVSVDFYEYFSATYPLLVSDKSLWCVSAWNDNGKESLINVNASGLLYRTDFFPGLGWMTTQDVWQELRLTWPLSYWDDWMRMPSQRRDRACIRPEVSRTRTFGKKGISNGLFFDKHLRFIHLNQIYNKFTETDVSVLKKEEYDATFDHEVQSSQVVTLEEVIGSQLEQGGTYRLIYHTKEVYLRMARALGLMDDFKAGVPRAGYKGVVSLFHKGSRIYLAPGNSWKGYDPSWA